MASILKGGRVVFNISGNNYRLIVKINYRAGVVDIRFFEGFTLVTLYGRRAGERSC